MKSSYALSFILILIIAAFNESFAQSAGRVSGAILQDGTKARIADAKIRNLRTGQSSISNQFGLFELTVLPGDTLQVERTGFLTLKIAVQHLSNLNIRLKLSNQLSEVKITGKLASKSFKESSAAYSKEKGIFYGGKPPLRLLIPINGKPLTFFYELLGKDGRRVRRLNHLAKQAAEAEEIEVYFNNHIIQQAVQIDSAQLEDFKILYTPKLDKLKKWSNYERTHYIKTSFKDFTTIKK